MSAYIVNDKTVSVIVKAFEIYKVNYIGEGYEDLIDDLDKRRQSLGQSLVDQNYRSVNCRYREYDPPHKFAFTDINLMVNGKLDTGLIVGCIDCYEYESSENKEYYGSSIQYWLKSLKNAILKQYIKQDGFEISWGYRK